MVFNAGILQHDLCVKKLQAQTKQEAEGAKADL